ncbi:peptidoglycan/xylan/chitin deacetylase (PgdA/CDA1 family) [Paraburkholderia sp. MM5482-R1]
MNECPNPPRRWPRSRNSALLNGTIGWHVIVLIGVAVAPAAWPWWLAAIVANHALFTIAGLLPRTTLLGPNWTRLPANPRNADAIALTIDDGPDPVVTPQVLDLLDAFDVRATFFCIGAKVERYPQLAREIVARGHGLENHSQVHVHTFSVTFPRALTREIAAAQRTLETVSGARPMFFRARPPACATSSWSRCCASSICVSRPGHGAATIRASVTLTWLRGGCSMVSPRATSCCCTMATPR